MKIKSSASACHAWIYLIAVMLYIQSPVFGNSYQTDPPGPTLPADGRVHGRVLIGTLVGSDVYDAVGSLGATFPIGSAGEGDIYFHGDILSWVETGSNFKFTPRRVVYTLEPGLSYTRDNRQYRFFVKHQSFHDVDGFDGLDESYEIYGVSYQTSGSPEIYVSVGSYQNRTVVDYVWDIAASATFDLKPVRGRDTYLLIRLHHVTEDSNPRRNGFTDYAGELGIRFDSGVVLFGRYELLHDIDRFDGTADHQVLIGTRYVW